MGTPAPTDFLTTGFRAVRRCDEETPSAKRFTSSPGSSPPSSPEGWPVRGVFRHGLVLQGHHVHGIDVLLFEHGIADAMCLGRDFKCGRLTEAAHPLAALVAHQVGRAAPLVRHFSGGGDLEAFLHPLVSLQFRHGGAFLFDTMTTIDDPVSRCYGGNHQDCVPFIPRDDDDPDDPCKKGSHQDEPHSLAKCRSPRPAGAIQLEIRINFADCGTPCVVDRNACGGAWKAS